MSTLCITQCVPCHRRHILRLWLQPGLLLVSLFPGKVLFAAILEMNDFFDKGRSYSVMRDFEMGAKEIKDHIGGDHTEVSSPTRVIRSWPKDLHLSPFNSRKGSYSLIAKAPLGPNMEGFQGIDITVSPASSQGRQKVVSRLCSEYDALDPKLLNLAQKARFIFDWF
ncbi:Fc.00g098340.m01.CDS01 [Cosmosporella sp. VM-42]